MIVNCIKNVMVCLGYVPSLDNLAGIFTNVGGKVLLSIFRSKHGAHTNPT